MMRDRAHLLHDCLRRYERTWPASVDLSDLNKLDEFFCSVTGAAPTDSAKELKARAKAVGKMLALAETAGCGRDAPIDDVVAKLREMAAHGWLRLG